MYGGTNVVVDVRIDVEEISRSLKLAVYYIVWVTRDIVRYVTT